MLLCLGIAGMGAIPRVNLLILTATRCPTQHGIGSDARDHRRRDLRSPRLNQPPLGATPQIHDGRESAELIVYGSLPAVAL